MRSVQRSYRDLLEMLPDTEQPKATDKGSTRVADGGGGLMAPLQGGQVIIPVGTVRHFAIMMHPRSKVETSDKGAKSDLANALGLSGVKLSKLLRLRLLSVDSVDVARMAKGQGHPKADPGNALPLSPSGSANNGLTVNSTSRSPSSEDKRGEPLKVCPSPC